MENRVTRRTHALAHAGVLATLGVALTLAAPYAASAQGRCAGGANENTPACDKTPAKAPFAPTGWKTVALDHFTVQAEDYKKEAGYFAALMNWKVISDDGKQAVLDIGDNVGTVVIKGGYTPPPVDSAAMRQTPAQFRRPPAHEVWSGFAWVISPWDAKKVQAELQKRGLNPVAENDAKTGFESFHVKDPDGFDVQLTNGKGYARDREDRAEKAAPVAEKLPFEKTNLKTIWLDHISFGVTNYKETTAWYQALLGWMPQGDEGSQNETWMCENCGNVIIRGGNPNDTSRPKPAVRRASIDHIAFGVRPFDPDAVKADLEKRGLTAREDTGGKGDIHEAKALYKSYHTTTPNGWDLQISNGSKENRTVR